MLSRPLLIASVAAATLALLTQATPAHAETVTPGAVTAAMTVASVTTPARLALTPAATAAMGSLMVVLDVLGIVERDAPKPVQTTRTATWLSPEPPKTPLLYSSLVVAKF